VLFGFDRSHEMAARVELFVRKGIIPYERVSGATIMAPLGPLACNTMPPDEGSMWMIAQSAAPFVTQTSHGAGAADRFGCSQRSRSSLDKRHVDGRGGSRRRRQYGRFGIVTIPDPFRYAIPFSLLDLLRIASAIMLFGRANLPMYDPGGWLRGQPECASYAE
jgi:hypothetical protein